MIIAILKWIATHFWIFLLIAIFIAIEVIWWQSAIEEYKHKEPKDNGKLVDMVTLHIMILGGISFVYYLYVYMEH